MSVFRPVKADDEADSGVSPAKKSKQSAVDEEKEKKEMKKQNELMFKYRDNLKDLSKSELHDLLEYNDQEIPEGEERVRFPDSIVMYDIMIVKIINI